jgi:hypothetical protein
MSEQSIEFPLIRPSSLPGKFDGDQGGRGVHGRLFGFFLFFIIILLFFVEAGGHRLFASESSIYFSIIQILP